MILHIVSDEKFIDRAYDVFEKASPENNEFMIISNKEKQFNYIKNTPITLISRNKFLSKEFTQNLINYDFIIIHAIFDDIYLQLIMNSDENIKFVWIGWGADYYKFLKSSLYLKDTAKLYESLTPTKQRIKDYVKKKLFFRTIHNKKKAINRINYFAPVLYEEYMLVKNTFKNFRPKYIDWNYPVPDEFLNEYMSSRINGNNILIGNSASFTNNHLEAFDRIKQLNIERRKIIVPLSYGNENYKSEIIKHGEKMFKEHFYPLLDFMSLNEYKKIISSCSVVIMNHLRQQAGDNIIMMLLLGAKIFLNKENPYYQFLIKNGVIIFSIDELNNENICDDLTHEQVDLNRDILRNIYNEDVSLNKTKNMIYTVMNHKI